MTSRIALMGASLFTANRGVSALGASLATLVWRARPDAAVSLLIGNRDARSAELVLDGRLRNVGTINYRLSPRAALREQLWVILLLSLLYRLAPAGAPRRWVARLSPWVQYVADAELVGDIRGGDSFSDIYGVRGFVMGCLPVLSVIWIRGGIHLLPQTYGPFRSPTARWFARYILLRAQSVWCRDRASLTEVSRLTAGKRAGELSPDVAFALESRLPDHPAIDPPLPDDRRGTLIGINVSGLMYHGGFTRANMFGLTLDYPAFVRRLVEQLLAPGSTRVLLIPHTFAPEGRVESDPDACRDVMDHLAPSVRDRVHLVTKAYDQHEIKGIVGLCEFFVGSRMHACIAALSQGIPAVGVAYSRKFAGVFETVGAEAWVIDGRTVAVDDALARIEQLFAARHEHSPHLGARADAAREDLVRVFGRIVGETTREAGNR